VTLTHRLRRTLCSGLLLGMALVGCRSDQRISDTPTSRPIAPSLVPSTPTPEPPSTSTATPGSRGSIVVWLDWRPASLTVLERVVESFLALNPSVSLAVAYFPSEELRSRFESAATQGVGPTILIAPSSWGPELLAEGLVRDVSARITSDLRDDLHPLARSQVEFNGQVLGLPLGLEGVVLFRNRTLLSQPIKTVDEWVATAQSLAAAGGSRTGLDLAFLNSTSQLAVCDGALVGDEGRPGFATQAGLCWLDLLTQLARVGPPTFHSEDDLLLFEDQQSPWLIDLAEHADRLSNALGDESLAIDAWPTYTPTARPLVGYVWTENLYFTASSRSNDFDASWAFATYLLSPEVQVPWGENPEARNLPVRADVAIEEPWLQEILSALSTGVPLPLIVGLEEFVEPLEREIQAAVVRGADPGFALQRAAAEIDRQLVAQSTPPTAVPTP